LWLIAEREFRAYVATTSFWVALLIGPMISLGVALVLMSTGQADPRTAISITGSPPPGLLAALDGAGALEGRRFRVDPHAKAAPALAVSAGEGGALRLTFSSDFPLSPAARQLVANALEHEQSPARGASPPPALVTVASPTPAAAAQTAQRFARLAVVVIVWLTLTGSLGMLLQAVVRERANRALETLLAAARGWEIVFGKLLGVGAVSLLLLVSWLGSCLAPSLVGASAPGAAGVIIHEIVRPALIAQALGAYVLGFGFYGLLTIAVGAGARDTASAQNYSRPMFAMLLAGFFAALMAWNGASPAIAWLAYLPPFSPFLMILVQPAPLAVALSIALILAAAVIAGRLAVLRLR
jgi:ABC-2 type transport system permease protein